ncbi:hypothetical protein [Bifidobacterium platyrrhinorum]|uniref:Uncharacterized protein n=1 Tax=Bifidobacterium platyrrhinorum TaxID=2661628 RepID=A0A6L9SS78_9BIFI|nr:hypothetical protein [Bifidobacterium platyrrhinorum]NEG55447.1 hypothetical protein [Bifidobacterium platyrrhinorum]
MSEIREMAGRYIIQAAQGLPGDMRFSGHGEYVDMVRDAAMRALEGADGQPMAPPSPDTMELLIKESGLSLDMLDERACEAYSQKYSTVYDRYICAIGHEIDDILGWEA